MGSAKDRFLCIDRNGWGALHQGDFMRTLRKGYLPEGSRWKYLKTGEVFMVIGPGAPEDSDDREEYPQKLVRITNEPTRPLAR